MVSIISVEQRFVLLAKIGEYIDWDLLTAEQVDIGIREAKKGGAEITTLIRNGFEIRVDDYFCETGELALHIPALARPVLAELQSQFGWIKRIERDTSPIHNVTLALGTVLKTHEQWISGGEYERRIATRRRNLLGYQHTVWLLEHQHELPMFMRLLGNVYIDFQGLVVADADNNLYFPSLSQHSSQWYMCRHRVELDLALFGRIAVSDT